MHDRLPPKGMCSGSRDLFKFWEISDNEEKMPVKQIKNWSVFDEIQISIATFVACLMHFHLTSHPFKIAIESPQAHGDSSQSPYPSHIHTHGYYNPHGDPGTHGSNAKKTHPCVNPRRLSRQSQQSIGASDL